MQHHHEVIRFVCSARDYIYSSYISGSANELSIKEELNIYFYVVFSAQNCLSQFNIIFFALYTRVCCLNWNKCSQ